MLDNVWIISNEGKIIFQRIITPQIQTDFFGKFISALSLFVCDFNEEGLINFELDDNWYLIDKTEKLLFIANYRSKIFYKNISIELHEIKTKFVHTYPKCLWEQWNGDSSFFDSFNSKIEENNDQFKGKLKREYDNSILIE